MIRLISTPSTSASGSSKATSNTHPPGPQPRSRIFRKLDGSAIPESGPLIACVTIRSWFINRAISVGLSESKTYVLVGNGSIKDASLLLQIECGDMLALLPITWRGFSAQTTHLSFDHCEHLCPV